MKRNGEAPLEGRMNCAVFSRANCVIIARLCSAPLAVSEISGAKTVVRSQPVRRGHFQ